MITQAEIREKYIYNQFNGLFFYRDVGLNENGIGCVASKYDQYGYLTLSKVGKCVSAHRLAFLYMTGSMPEMVVDHINHVRDDNSWCNLRDVSRAKNNTNLLPRGFGEYSDLYRSKGQYSKKTMIRNIKMLINSIDDEHISNIHGYLLKHSRKMQAK